MPEIDIEQRLEQIRDAGAHPHRFRPLVALARRILWPLIRPYHRRQLELAEDVTSTAAPGRTSYAQAGEDRVVAFVLERLGVPGKDVVYADLGAAMPEGDSNTFLLYRNGGRGLLVEADPEYRAAYASLRPEDDVLSVAVVPERMRAEGTIRFHLCHDPGWNSVLREHVDEGAQLGKGGVRKTIVAETRTINEVLERFAGRDLHLLSVDVEGLDAALIDELDFDRIRPWILIVEGVHENDGRLASVLSERGYEYYASTYINSIWLDRPVLERLKTRF